MRKLQARGLVATATALALAACGGGGERVASTPTPVVVPPPPPPPPPTSLNIFASAPTGEFAVSGASFSGEYSDPDPMKSLSLSTGDVPRFRYDATTQTYEIMLPGRNWDTLITNDQSLPDWGRRLVPSSAPNGPSSIFLNRERSLNEPDAFPSSTLGQYYDGTRAGWIALGIPTPSNSLPTSGSATFDGLVRGWADVFVDDGWGGVTPAEIGGTVTLSFNFGQSSLTGSMSPSLGNVSLGTFSFTNTVYSAGSYSGSFDTSVAGVNSFTGTLTGTSAQELIGAWALPFHYSVDDTDHQAAGAWIAKRGP